MWTPDKLKVKVITEYLTKEVSMNTLAAKYGVSSVTIGIWLNKRGIVNKYYKRDSFDQLEAIRLYVKERMRVEDIAASLKVGIHPINTILRKAGVKRTQADSMMGRYLGERNPNWKGGRMNRDDLRSRVEHYAKKMSIFSLSVKLRDGYACMMCKSKEKLEANHIKPVRYITEEKELFDINNGITLCRKCHIKIHHREHEFEDTFRKLLKKSHELRETPHRL